VVGIPAGVDASLPLLTCTCCELEDLTADARSAVWKDIVPAFLREAVTGTAPKQCTELRVAWSPAELRVLFQCADTEPLATLTERDAPLYKEEVVEVFFDPIGDLESYFEIEVNPLNAVLDVILRKNRSGYLKDFAWDCEGLRTCARNAPDGWAAELSVPFGALVSEAPRPGARWRVNFCRIDRPRNAERELTAWSPPFRPQFHTPERFGVLEFVAESVTC
jgi:hypothetical protein